MNFCSESSPSLHASSKKRGSSLGKLGNKTLVFRIVQWLFGANGFAMTHKVHNLKVKTLVLTCSVFIKVLPSVLSFVGETMAL